VQPSHGIMQIISSEPYNQQQVKGKSLLEQHLQWQNNNNNNNTKV